MDCENRVYAQNGTQKMVFTEHSALFQANSEYRGKRTEKEFFKDLVVDRSASYDTPVSGLARYKLSIHA